MLKSPLAIQQHGFEVVIGVNPFIPKASVPHLQVDNGFRCFVDQPVSVARARLEARTHARRQAGEALIGVQGRVTLQNVHKFILRGVGMAQR